MNDNVFWDQAYHDNPVAFFLFGGKREEHPPQWEIRYSNPAAQRMAAVCSEEHALQRLLQHLGPDWPDALARTDGEPEERTVYLKEGNTWLRLEWFPCGEGNYGCTMQDCGQPTHWDPMTSCLNKEGFKREATRLMRKTPERNYVVWYADIRRFKYINDALGYEAGDQILHLWSEMLRSLMREGETYGHISGDRFVILSWYDDQYALKQHYQESLVQLNNIIHQSLGLNDELEIKSGAYLVKSGEVETRSIDQMVDWANVAQKNIKDSADDNIAFFTQDMWERQLHELEIVHHVRSGIAGGEFSVCFQPQFDYQENRLCGAEALVIWDHPNLGRLSPGEFILILERNGQITELDRYLWEEVCRALRRWIDRSEGVSSVVPISVNVSRIDIHKGRLCEFLQELLRRYDLPTSLLRIEITESAYTEDTEQVVSVTKQLREMGLTVEMDDFGSGYSSLNMLQEIPVDILKLDMHFLDRNTSRSGKILGSVIRMAHWLELPVIAEGVETASQAEYLKSMGCYIMQGYYFARPLPEQEFLELMNANVRGEIRNYQDQNQDLKSVTAMLGVEEKGDFWFTNCMGGAALMEYDGQTVEVFRLNDALYDMIGLPRKVTDNYRTHATDLVGPKLRPAIHQMMDEAAEKGDAECELEIKLRSELRWIRCSFRRLSASGQNVIIFVLLEDVTRKRLMELNRADQWQQHMCRILAEMPSLAVFEYDPQNDRMHFFRGMARRMGDEQITERYLENLEQQTRLTPASAKLIQAAFLAALQGPIMDSVDFQADYYGTGFHWFRIRYHSISDEGGNIIRIVGQLDNAEKEIKREQVLREQARRDAMTGLLNHDTLELEISKAIGECDGGTLLVVDLDNFKRVNDRLGHHYGDLLLQRVSDVIRSLFREGDLVGRFGGDEFVAFMPGVKSDHLPGQRAGEIVQSINTIELPELGHAGCSVGVAVAKNKTVSWQELFRRADYALYEAKRAGKGGYVLYEGERSVYRMPEVGPRTDLPSGILEARPRMLAGDVFDILYHNGGSEAAIQAALGYVGRWIEVSRSYIFETDPDGVRCTNTFEWCKEGIPPEKDNLQHILLAENGTSLYDNFDKDDIFYCPDVRDLPDWQRELVEAQGIGAMLWKALRWNGEIRGFVGFDINGETCGWVKEQVESMRRIAAVIGVFLRLLRDSQGTFS